MTQYTGASPIVGQGRATAAQIDALFAAVAHERNQHVATPPAGLGQAFITLAAKYPQPVNHDLAAAQSAHETAGWTSFWASKNNPAGIGVTGVAGKGEVFDSPEDGITAQVAHLLDYAAGVGPWSVDDPRFAAMSLGSLGSAWTLHGLNGQWAVPGVGYDEAIASLANRLLTMGGAPPMQGDDPRFAWVPDSDEFGYPVRVHGRVGLPIELIVMHFTAGTDSLAYLLEDHQSSCTYLTDRAGRPRAQLVREEDACWCGGNAEYNERGIHVEVEKLEDEPWTDELVREVARTVAPLALRRSIPFAYLARANGRGTRGFIGHGDIPDPYHPGQWGGSSHHHDPGYPGDPDGGPAFPWDAFLGYCRQIGTPVPPVAPPDRLTMPPLDPRPRDGHLVPYLFGQHYDAHGGVEVFGLFRTGVFVEDGKLCQYTEAYRYEYQPAVVSQVERGLLGNEVLAVRYPQGAPA